MKFSTQGMVTREFRHEDSRVVRILTRDYGVITAFAGRANRPHNPLAASTEMFCYSDFVIFKNKNKFSVDSADPINIFFGIRSDFEKLTLASYLVQLAEELSPIEERSDAFLDLLLKSIYYLEQDSRDPLMIKAITELRLLSMAGYMPDLVSCASCASFEKENFSLSMNGELFCGKCRSEETALYSLSVSDLAAMRHIIYAPKEKLFGFAISGDGLVSLGNITEKYMKYQIEKTLPALEFYKSAIIEQKKLLPKNNEEKI